MPTAHYSTPVPSSPQALYDWHARPDAIQRLIPPWSGVRLISQTGDFAHRQVVLSTPLLGPVRRRLISRHVDVNPGHYFRDEQVSGPFASWKHAHNFLPDPQERPDHSLMRDELEYEVPMGKAGRNLLGRPIAQMVDRTFAFRHRRLLDDLSRHARFAAFGPRKIVLSGASGLVGSLLTAFFTTGGHTLTTLVRRQPEPRSNQVRWDPETGDIDAAALEGMDAFVHLSGQNIEQGRWTERRKDAFINSRVASTSLLCRTLLKLKQPPRVLVSASAVGIYGETGGEVATEFCPPGQGFLPHLCELWEAATRPADDAGIRVVKLRIGVVMSCLGGALAQLMTPFRMGLGGRIGSGRQYMSCISSDDLLGAVQQCIFDERLSGPVNAVCPDPVTNADLVDALARILHRPTLLPMPERAIDLLFGEMGRAVLLPSLRIMPAALQSVGFEFLHPTVEHILRWELGRPA